MGGEGLQDAPRVSPRTGQSRRDHASCSPATLQRLERLNIVLDKETPMNYYGGRELATSFRTVRSNTIQIAEEIQEAKYGFNASPDVRSIAQMLLHIAMGPMFQLHVQQNRFDDLTKVNFQELMAKVTAEE